MIGLTPATFEEFEREAVRGNVVPVVRSVLADLQTPVGAFLRVAEGARHAFLLESVEGGAPDQHPHRVDFDDREARPAEQSLSLAGAPPWLRLADLHADGGQQRANPSQA